MFVHMLYRDILTNNIVKKHVLRLRCLTRFTISISDNTTTLIAKEGAKKIMTSHHTVTHSHQGMCDIIIIIIHFKDLI